MKYQRRVLERSEVGVLEELRLLCGATYDYSKVIVSDRSPSLFLISRRLTPYVIN